MKKTYYFSHDFNARNDIKLQELLRKMGYEGLGLYWCIVEMLYEQEGKIKLTQCDSIAYAMRTDINKIKQLIDVVFEKNNEFFWSNSVLNRIKMRKEKSNKAKISIMNRWGNEPKKRNTTTNTNVIRTYDKRNTIKESKVKESKVNKNKINKEKEIKEKENYSLKSLTDNEFLEISRKYGVPLAFVRSKFDDLVNWHEKNPKKNHYENYYRGLMTWVKKDAMERRENAKLRSKISYVGDTL